jgi:hypothetical protein
VLTMRELPKAFTKLTRDNRALMSAAAGSA